METRWRRLIDAGIAVTSELTLDAALQRIVETATKVGNALAGARPRGDGGGCRSWWRSGSWQASPRRWTSRSSP